MLNNLLPAYQLAYLILNEIVCWMIFYQSYYWLTYLPTYYLMKLYLHWMFPTYLHTYIPNYLPTFWLTYLPPTINFQFNVYVICMFSHFCMINLWNNIYKITKPNFLHSATTGCSKKGWFVENCHWGPLGSARVKSRTNSEKFRKFPIFWA